MRFGISEKIVLLFLLLIVSLEATTSSYFINHERKTILAEFDERAKALSQSFVITAEYPVLVEDTNTLSILAQALLKQKDVIFCQVKNKQGQILFQKGTQEDEYARRYVLPIMTEIATTTQGEELLLGSSEKKSEQIGDVCLLFSLVSLRDTVNEAKATIIIFVVVGTSCAILFIVVLIKLILSRPIGELLKGISRISGGDLSYKVSVGTKDEIGQLADSFNSMTEHLRDLLRKERELAAEAATADIERNRAEELQQAYNELEKVNKELNDFAYIVSHDLKAPLRGIKTLASWLTNDLKDNVDNDNKEQLNLLLSRVDRMHNLIDGILQYSRVGRIQEEIVLIDLNQLVSDIIDSLAVPDNISITIENELPTIELGQTQTIQIFQNLLSNAVKYMDKPQGCITIGCVEEDGFWKFTIADNGPGIEEQYFEKIFKMFQTLSPRDEFESTGVGLTVVKKIIERCSGKIWVESEVGQGSKFLFTLPKQEEVIKNEKLQANLTS
jgi:signal transduction histidine kinase